MKQKNLWITIIRILFAVAIVFLIVNHKTIKNWLRDDKSQNIIVSEKMDRARQFNNFPLTPINDGYVLNCVVENVIFYEKYDEAPSLAGGWRSLADIQCTYYDSSEEKQTIYLPMHVYQENSQTELILYMTPKLQSTDKIVYGMPYNDLQDYQDLTLLQKPEL